MLSNDVPTDEPNPAELAAIEAEWPLIKAEIALVEAEIRVLTVHGVPSLMDWRRLRRAEARVLHAAIAFAAAQCAAPTRRAA